MKASFWKLLGPIPGNLIFRELKFVMTYFLITILRESFHPCLAHIATVLQDFIYMAHIATVLQDFIYRVIGQSKYL